MSEVYRLVASAIVAGHGQLVLVNDAGERFVANPALGVVLNGPLREAEVAALLDTPRATRVRRYKNSRTRTRAEVTELLGNAPSSAPPGDLRL